MANHENLSTPFIYLHSTGEKISVTKEQCDTFYKEQHHHRGICSKKQLWKCDGDCIGCKYHATRNILSLDIPTEDNEANMYDCILNSSPSIEDVLADRLLLEQLFTKLRKLDSDVIIQCWLDDYNISNRALQRSSVASSVPLQLVNRTVWCTTDKVPATKPATKEKKKPHLKLEDVRAVLIVKSRARHTADIRTLLQKYRASKFSSVVPKHYAVLLKDTEVLDNDI